MENNTICQSCGMPLTKDENFGTESNGTKNRDYCHYCYENGGFVKDETMEEMIQSCIPFEIEAGVYENAEVARKAMFEIYPKLKRWETQ